MFERRFVEYALELANAQSMTQRDFASAVWPEKSEASANTTIIALKKQNSRGKPQNLRMSDAIRMAEVLGREFPSLCFEVWEQVKISVKSLNDVPREKNEFQTEEHIHTPSLFNDSTYRH